LSHKQIGPVDYSCKFYRSGHQVHWIQAKKSREEEQAAIEVSVVVRDNGRVDLHGDGVDESLWNHHPARLQSVLNEWGRAVWKPRFHVSSVPGLSGYVVNLATAAGRVPCVCSERSVGRLP